MVHQTFGAYHFGASRLLSKETLSALVSVFQEKESDPTSRLEGRRPVSRLDLPQIGPVVVKHYRRGGWVARVNQKYYLRTGKTRCQAEYEQMARAGRLGVNVPAPVTFAFKGRFLYQGWLITREIANQQTLARLSLLAPGRLPAVMASLRRQVSKLVADGLWHVDLHPGNVLVDDRGRVFLVDFDKTRTFRGAKLQLLNKYRKRWRRAVKKHGLPKELMTALDDWPPNVKAAGDGLL
jgi:3-deoxy-D-manno-octulosonic acid kinase